MSNIKDIQNDFTRNVKDFEMKIELDQGVHRSILFINKSGSSVHHFRLNTWHNHLCISGDVGTYVFCRLPDMFEFFRGEPISPRYWGEKLTAIDKQCGYLEPCFESFKEYVSDHVAWFAENKLDDEDRKEFQSAIDDMMGDCDDSFASVDSFINALRDFNCKDFSFDLSDLSSKQFEKYTTRYVWCLHAIQWGINQYDKSKAGAA